MLLKRGTHGSLGTAGIVCALVLASIASSSAAFGASSTDPASFSDPTGDAIGGAPDVSTVVISTDSSGRTTFQITTNEASLLEGQWIYLDLDVDQNLATGNPTHFGAEYVLSVGAGGKFGAVRWANGSWQNAPLASLSGSYANSVATLAFNNSDLGDPDGFNLYIVAQNVSDQTPDADWAPNSGVWNYKLRIGELKLSVVFFHAPRSVKAGKPFAVALEVTRSDTGEFVGSGGQVGCRATVAGKRMSRPLYAGFQTVGSESAAFCGWRAPYKALAKTIRGSITVSFGGASVSHRFATKVK
jgi:hypothetical protein